MFHSRATADVAFFKDSFLAYQGKKKKKKKKKKTPSIGLWWSWCCNEVKQQQATVPPTFEGRNCGSSRDDHEIQFIWSFGLYRMLMAPEHTVGRRYAYCNMLNRAWITCCASSIVPIEQQMAICFALAIFTTNGGAASELDSSFSTKPTARRRHLFSFLLCCEASCDYGDRNVPPKKPRCDRWNGVT